jgi:hypothetical protein
MHEPKFCSISDRQCSKFPNVQNRHVTKFQNIIDSYIVQYFPISQDNPTFNIYRPNFYQEPLCLPKKSTSYAYNQATIDVVLTYLYHVVFTAHERVEDWKKSIVAVLSMNFFPNQHMVKLQIFLWQRGFVTGKCLNLHRNILRHSVGKILHMKWGFLFNLCWI